MTDPNRDDAVLRYALGEMSAEEERAFVSELADDPTLREEAQALRRSFELIGHAAASDPAPELRARVLAAATREPAPVMRPVRWVRRAALAAVAASIVVAIGLDDLRLRRELALLSEVNETLHQPNVVVSFALEGGGAHGHAILDLDAKKAAMVIDGLPALPEGEAYWLWAEVGDRFVPCGRFEATGDARIVRQFAIPVEDYSEPVRRLLLTVEAAEGATAPQGPTVMTSA